MAPHYFAARVVDNRDLGAGYWILSLEGEEPSFGPVEPGQFVMLRGEWGRELLNPRAFSVLRWQQGGSLAVLIKVHGEGTRRLAKLQRGDEVMVTGPLGRGFASPRASVRQLLVAGGVGLPPLHLQALEAARRGLAKQVELFYGGRTAADLVLLDELAQAGIKLSLATEDGSRGHHGRVTEPLTQRLEQARTAGQTVELLACGPTGMLAAVRRIGLTAQVDTWLCMEEQMACGFGVCLGCAIPTTGERPYRYCCTDGPVFSAQEVRWS